MSMGQKYGQHFLHDDRVIQHIADTIHERVACYGADTVVEIGPGKGALTKYLLKQSYHLVLSEIDTSLQKHLEHSTKGTDTTIIWGDVLQQDIQNATHTFAFGGKQFVGAKTLVVGNLPYYITSPILRKFFTQDLALPAGVFLIQHEVADKIRWDAKKKSYLRWLLNKSYRVSYAFPVPATCFTPPPKVLSAVIIVEKLASPCLEDSLEPRLLQFLDIVSGFKRKTLGKIAKMQEALFDGHGFSVPEHLCGKRLEELGWEEMVLILKR